jgi:hypothetical protein
MHPEAQRSAHAETGHPYFRIQSRTRLLCARAARASLAIRVERLIEVGRRARELRLRVCTAEVAGRRRIVRGCAGSASRNGLDLARLLQELFDDLGSRILPRRLQDEHS